MGKRGGEVDGRSDLYSLGVMMHEMLTGALPFHSDTPIGLLMHHIQTPLTPLNVSRPELGIPDEVSGLLLKAMAKDRTQRFQSGEEMAQVLARTSAKYTDDAAAAGRPSTATFNTEAMLAAAAAATSATATTEQQARQMNQPVALAVGTGASPTAPGKAALMRDGRGASPPPTSGPPVSAAPPLHLMTKVMGSDVMEPVKPMGQKRAKLKYALIGTGVMVFAIVAWLAWPAKQSAIPAITEETIPAVTNSNASGNRHASGTVRSGSGRRGSAEVRAQQPPPQTNGADKLRSQELTARGWREISQKSYRNAEDDFQEALRLDPGSSSAQKGLQAAQAAETMQGITGIFRR